MEEEVGIKVTRLRRRLSVEAEDVKSPSTQSTPTKKRGGRLAAKPQLELIDENAIETEKPKRTRKSVARDAEPDEKAVTPSRRSTRTRSNTSLVSDAPVEAEEMGTPARRSTRIKSNTSIVAETVPFADSPRAKRAARRTSQVGSDNEEPITPARQTRRTRKDSTSSIDKPVETNAAKAGAQIKEVIAEEVENKSNETSKATPAKSSDESHTTRKSPRLNEKAGRKSTSLDNDNKENEPQIAIESHNDKSESGDGSVITSNTIVDKTAEPAEDKNLSVSSSNLIKDLDAEPKKGKVNLNKSSTDADLSQIKSKRHRTKSWTTITSSPSHDYNFLSDTEAIEKKSNNMSGSGDSLLNTNSKVVSEHDDIKEVSLDTSITSEKKKKKKDKSMILDNTDIKEVSVINSATKPDNSTIETDNNELKSQKDDPNFTEKFFGAAPSGPVLSLVYIEDSDSNTGSVDKVHINQELESGDQCVPVVEHQLNDENNKQSKNDLSYEPMDIDETMPENVSLSAFTDKNVSDREEEKRNSLLNVSEVNNVNIHNSVNKSLRKSMQESDTEIGLNKSKRQSMTSSNDINDGMNKSKRKSSINMDLDDNAHENSKESKQQTAFEENINQSISKSKSESSAANVVNSEDNLYINSSNTEINNDELLNKSSNKSERKSSIVNIDQDMILENANKSKRTSSVSKAVDEYENNGDESNIKSADKSKRKSSISNTDPEISIDKGNESKRKVSISNIADEDSDMNKKNSNEDENHDDMMPVNKSKRKSSIVNTDQDISIDEGNKSKRKVSISNIADEDSDINKKNSNEDENHDDMMPVNKSKRKSSIVNIDQDISIDKGHKSKRNVSISNIADEDSDINKKNSNEGENHDDMMSVNKSKRKSSIVNIDQDISIDKRNKSKRKSSISDAVNEDDDIDTKNLTDGKGNEDKKTPNKSKRKSSIVNDENAEADVDITAAITNKSLVHDNDVSKISNKTKRKSSITNAKNDDSVLKETDISKRKPISIVADADEVDSGTDKSKRKCSIVHIDDIVNNSANKSKKKSLTSDVLTESNIEIMDQSSSTSKRKSLVSHMDSEELDKSNIETKSTLVLSQLKDISDSNVPKNIYELNESNDSNEQLSKSANVPNINKDKESEKKNLSLTYSTSTPLQQKSIKKLGMQINTSIIAPNSVTKTNKSALNKSKNQTSVLSKNDEETEPSDEDDEEESEEDDSEDEEDSEEESELLGNSKMIDDEAEEASDDYESGDSRDEDEKEYEAQHEIVDKGETLDSQEEEFSDDSDYERDSFIVDSDDEDNELLSGSGDDLSLSDNELKMSAKSKKKFNERKMKEQKKASREMFNARHSLNKSDKSTKSDKIKSKKGNRQRFESSDSEDDEEISAQPKKNRRARIDSSQDISQHDSEADKSLSNKKRKKVKRLSESVCEDTPNEKEITIQDNGTDKVDPLSLQNIVKTEPKTPQKDLNISTVAITNNEEIEEVHLDGNVSVVKMNQTSDPLQATIAQDDDMEEDSDDESISENEEITQNYESVLSDLNKKSKKMKSLAISLNLNKKSKQKPKEPIVDELNLTQVKKSKKGTSPLTEDSKPKQLDKEKSFTKKIVEKEKKSISIIDEGSSDSIDMKLLFNEDSTDGENNAPAAKKSDSKQVIEDFIPLKRTEGKTNILESTNGTDGEHIGFFIDTTGTHTDIDQSATNTSMKSSAKKKKDKKIVSSVNIEEVNDDDDSNDAPLEVSYHSEKNNKSKQSLNTTQTDVPKVDITVKETPSQSAKKKKKDKEAFNNSQVIDTDAAADKSINTSILATPGTNKKKRNLSEIQPEQSTDETEAETAHNMSVGSAKKQKKKSLSVSLTVEEKKYSTGETPAAIIHNVSIGSAKKQKNKSVLEKSAIEEKKVTVAEEAKGEIVHNVSVGSAKKQKKKLISETSVAAEEDATGGKTEAETANTSIGSAKKQKKKSALESSAFGEVIVTADTSKTTEGNVAKKRKRKSSANPSFEENTVKVSDDTKALNTSKALEESILATNQKKKRKIVHNGGDEVTVPGDITGESTVGRKNKNKTMEQKPAESQEITNRKKRRADGDSDGNKSSKIPRLPAHVLKQLDDKPKKDIETKKDVTSTTSFMVEETRKRRNKPSNYLEESVYLNDSMEEKTKKSAIKKPKVLPFLPTASTSSFGFTTNFRVNVIPQETQFIAQSSDVSNFKKDFLQKNRIKKLGTFEMYKRHRSIKISKF